MTEGDYQYILAINRMARIRNPFLIALNRHFVEERIIHILFDYPKGIIYIYIYI